MGDDLKHAEQQMLAKRPWERAEPESIWEITGVYPGGKGTFTQCLAMTAASFMTGQHGADYRPVFFMIAPSLQSTGMSEPIVPSQIHHARPLILVYRDEPTLAYYEDDQDLLRRED